MLRDDVFAHAYLGAQHHVGVLGDDTSCGIHLSEVDVVELRDGEAGQPMVRDVHKSEQPSP